LEDARLNSFGRADPKSLSRVRRARRADGVYYNVLHSSTEIPFLSINPTISSDTQKFSRLIILENNDYYETISFLNDVPDKILWVNKTTKEKIEVYFKKPFHVVLGASMISKRSELFRQLVKYKKQGTIGTIIHDEVQDEGDSSAGVGGETISEAYSNAFGLMFPLFSRRFHGPSFLNTHPEKGHIHRKRSKTVQKALDYIKIIMIRHKLAGDHYMDKAIAVIDNEIH